MRVWPGASWPLGATWDGAGVNFAVFSEHASAIWLCLFDSPAAIRERIALPLTERTGHIWHGYISGLAPGQLYGFRVDGPWAPRLGHRFSTAKVLLDPYARAIGRPLKWGPALFVAEDPPGTPDSLDSAANAPLGAVHADAFDWGEDRRPATAWRDTVIYELHVKGMTALHPDVPVALRGTYLGLASAPVLTHLRRLGVTAVELMPIHQHADEWPLVARGLTNYWGYSTLAFSVPDARFATVGGDPTAEFKTMVRGLHQAGLEVILDVVYNHTSEGHARGPTVSFRGFDNASYYRLRPDDLSQYDDVTGTGNALNLHHPHVLRLVMDSLRYWVEEMHVDGFRFDLATTLARGPSGFDAHAPFLQAVAQDPVLSGVKLIAEPWDVGMDGYRVGHFPAGWSEWNGRYRDAARRFWRGDQGALAQFATGLAGSSDLYGTPGRRPSASVNFITSHDGFTLADLSAYVDKHNEANGEENRDGDPNNFSWNGGVEGPTSDRHLQELRRRRQRSALLTLAVSLGVPMISGGDEVGRTQIGNNNAYCQDSALSWTSWASDPHATGLTAFAARAFAFRRRSAVLRRRRFLNGRGPEGADVIWLRPDGVEMEDADWWSEVQAFAGLLDGPTERDAPADAEPASVLLLFNAGPRPQRFVLPSPGPASAWVSQLDTADPDAPPARLAPGGVWIVPAYGATAFVWS